MTFFVTARCMEINDRPVDFLQDESEEQTRQRLDKIFTVYNALHQGDSDFRKLSADTDEDISYYFGELLPRLQARNLARLHDMGLVHKFPVPGNVTALGGIVDLDSVHGEPLGIGDAAITFDDIRRDVAMVFDEDYGSYYKILRKISGNIPLSEGAAFETIQKMRECFIKTYIETRAQELSLRERLILFAETCRGGDIFIVTLAAHDYVYGMVQEALVEEVNIVIDARSALQAARQIQMSNMRSHAARAADLQYDRIKDDPDIEDIFNDLDQTTLSYIERAAIGDAVDGLSAGGMSEAFDRLVGGLDLSSETEKHVSAVLAHTLISPHTAFADVRNAGDFTYDFMKSLGEAVDSIFAAVEEPAELLIVAVKSDIESNILTQAENNPDSPDEHWVRYRMVQYKVNTRLSLEDVLADLAVADDDVRVEIHYDREGSRSQPNEAVRSLPLSCIATDSARLVITRAVFSDGSYGQTFEGDEDMTYLATVSIEDKEGIFHVIITENPPDLSNTS